MQTRLNLVPASELLTELVDLAVQKKETYSRDSGAAAVRTAACHTLNLLQAEAKWETLESVLCYRPTEAELESIRRAGPYQRRGLSIANLMVSLRVPPGVCELWQTSQQRLAVESATRTAASQVHELLTGLEAQLAQLPVDVRFHAKGLAEATQKLQAVHDALLADAKRLRLPVVGVRQVG